MTVNCTSCGVVFGSNVLEHRMADGQTFYCPNGHQMHYRVDEVDAEVQPDMDTAAGRLTNILDGMTADEQINELEYAHTLCGSRRDARRALALFRRKGDK